MFSHDNTVRNKFYDVSAGQNDTTKDYGPPPKKVPELLVLTTAGDNLDGTELTQFYSAVVNGNGVRRINSHTF